MKSLRSLPVRGCVLLSLFLALFASGAGIGLPQAGEPPAERPPCCRTAPTNSPPTGGSLYQLESIWTSDVGARVRLRVLEGRPQVVALFFTHCEYACPVLVRDLKRIEAALPETIRPSVDFLLISLDSERDTPAVLAEYRESHRLGLDHWTLLTGAGDDVRELAALLGVNYRKDARGQYSHSNLITVLNARGEVIHQQAGLDQDPAATVAALVKEAGSVRAK
ncbi:MAG: SCO family protein [Verrucomicrobiales bacterium]|nr:SCO family protein [Verrucomicrobiales bacterium]